MEFEKQIMIWRTITWVVPFVAALLIGISQWRINKIETLINERKKIEADKLQSAFENRVLENLNNNLIDRADEVYPGFGISAIVTIGEQNDESEKFILDAGDHYRDRVSLFMDYENNLVYRVLDHSGQSYAIKIPQQLHTFRVGNTCYVLMELGSSETYSFIRLFINDKEVGRSEMNGRLIYSADMSSNSMIIGADINKQNNGKFTLSMLAVLKNTLTKKQREQLFGASAKFHKDIGRL